MYVDKLLFRDERVATSIVLDKTSISVCCSEPGTDDVLKLSKAHRLAVANLFAQAARARLSAAGAAGGGAGYPHQDALSDDDVADAQIAEAAFAAFGGLGRDPFKEIDALLQTAGLKPQFSSWSNL